jgi:hypothetical protein
VEEKENPMARPPPASGVSQSTFDAVLAQFGVRRLVDLTNLMGYYALLAFNINAVAVELRQDSRAVSLPI